MNQPVIFPFFPKDNAVEVQVYELYDRRPEPGMRFRTITYNDCGMIIDLAEFNSPTVLCDYIEENLKGYRMFGKFEQGIMELNISELTLSEEIDIMTTAYQLASTSML